MNMYRLGGEGSVWGSVASLALSACRSPLLMSASRRLEPFKLKAAISPACHQGLELDTYVRRVARLAL